MRFRRCRFGYGRVMTNVLLAIDESERSQRAARTAQRCFGPDANYLAVYVDDERPMSDGALWGVGAMGWGGVYAYPALVGATRSDADSGPMAGRSVDDEMADARVQAAQLTEDAAVEARPIGEIGDPAEAILTAARSHHADVIVVGWHRKGWFAKWFDGSTADDLIGRAELPILLVPDTED